MAIQGQYGFLETVKESEAIARGANLSDKINHTVLKAIKAASTRQAVKGHKQFTLDTFVPDIVNLTKGDLRKVVSRLITDKVVVQVFRLEFVPGKEQPQLVPCFLSNPSEEEEQVTGLYNETVYQSITAIESFLDARPHTGAAEFLGDLEADLASERLPPPEKLAHTIADVFSAVHAKNFDIVPPPDLISVTLNEMRTELVRRGRIRMVPDYGVLPIRETEILERLETAGDFLKGKLIPRYRNRANCKRELEQIGLEEAGYHLDRHAPVTGQFIARRAQAVKKAVLSTLPQGQGVRFPGTLAVEVILQLEPLARDRFAERERAEQGAQVRDFKERLLRLDARWQEAIRFVPYNEIDEFHPDVWNRLLGDEELITGTWQNPEGLVHVFARRDPAVFRKLVPGMTTLPPDRKWQALAMRALLEQQESKPEFKALFDDPSFVAAYGKVLRMAYMDRIPWLYRLLLQFGITWFQDRSFQIAKQSIRREQEHLRSGNEEKNRELRARREQERQERLGRVQDLAKANQVIEVLDQLYLNEGHIPSVADVRARLEDFGPEEFFVILRRENFQVVPPPKGLEPDQGILLYPLNHEWRTRVARLRKVLDRLVEQAQAAGKDDAEDMVQLVARINKFITRAESGARNSTGGQEDPFAAFGRELEKHKERERAESAADLDV